MKKRPWLFNFTALLLLTCTAIAQPEGMSGGEIMESSVIEISGQNLRVRKSSDQSGALVLIANRSGQPLHISSASGISGTLDTHETTSWPCSSDTYFDNFVLETPDGHFIASPDLVCGDIIHIIAES